jgi:hypothetical protein
MALRSEDDLKFTAALAVYAYLSIFRLLREVLVVAHASALEHDVASAHALR